ncbi:MAG: glycosyltransferase family 4 protein [Salinivirgaceae bacterium]
MNILINSGRIPPFLTTRKLLIESFLKKGHNVYLTGYQNGYEDEVERMGAKLILVPFSRAGFNPLSDIFLIYRYFKIITRNNIDIVHSYTIKPNIYGSIAAKIAGIDSVFPTLNGVGYAFSGNGVRASITKFIASRLYKLAFLCSKKVFFHNSDDINLMVSLGLINIEKSVLTLGSGIDMEYYKEKKFPELISFLLVSRLLRSKGVLEYIQAAKNVKKKYSKIEFHLVGPDDPNPTGIKLDEIKPFIDDNIIIYHGQQNDVRPFIEKSAVLVLPSYREGVPHTILEAMSIGRAILTTDVPGCRETVVNSRNGFLVPLQNTEELTKKMEWMIENFHAVSDMGKQSVILAKERFNVHKVNSIINSTIGLA